MKEQKTEPAHQPGTGKAEEAVRQTGKEPGRYDTGTKGAGRRTGKTRARNSTGIRHRDPIDPQSPYLPPP